MLTITSHRGFHLRFSNGWTASVQWGPGNYGDHHDDGDFRAPEQSNRWESTLAEVAAWPRSGDMVRLDSGDTVKGYLDADAVLDFLNWVRSQPEESHVTPPVPAGASDSEPKVDPTTGKHRREACPQCGGMIAVSAMERHVGSLSCDRDSAAIARTYGRRLPATPGLPPVPAGGSGDEPVDLAKATDRPWRFNAKAEAVVDKDEKWVCQLWNKHEESFRNAEFNGPLIVAAVNSFDARNAEAYRRAVQDLRDRLEAALTPEFLAQAIREAQMDVDAKPWEQLDPAWRDVLIQDAEKVRAAILGRAGAAEQEPPHDIENGRKWSGWERA